MTVPWDSIGVAPLSIYFTGIVRGKNRLFSQSMMKLLRDNNSDPEYVEMRKMLFNPYELYACGGVDSVIRGAMNTSAGKSDAFFTPEVSVRQTKGYRKLHPTNPSPLPNCSLPVFACNT